MEQGRRVGPGERGSKFCLFFMIVCTWRGKGKINLLCTINKSIHSINSCNRLLHNAPEALMHRHILGRERFFLMAHLFFCLSTVTSSRKAWNKGVLPNKYQPVLGPGPRGSDRELMKSAASWHAPRGGQWIPGSDLEQSGGEWGGWARQPSSLQRPQPWWAGLAFG